MATKKKLVEPSKTSQASTTNSTQSKPTTATTTTSKNTTESKNGTKSSSAPQQSEKVVEKSNKTTATITDESNKKNSAKNNSSSNNAASNSSNNNSKPANTAQSTTTVNSNPPVVVNDSGSSKKKKKQSSSSDTTNTITTAATPIVSTTVQSNKKNNSVTTNASNNTINNQSKNSVALVNNTTPISANSSSNIENVSSSKKKNKKNKSSQPEESPSNNGTVTKNETNSVTPNPTTVSNDIAVTAVQPTTTIVKEKKTHDPGKDDNSLSAWLCRAYFAIGLLIAWNVCFIIVLPMYICHILFGFDKNKSLMGWMFRYTNRCVVETNPFWNIKTFYANGSTKNRLPKKQKKVIFICNHQSGMDPFILISALPIEAKWVAKHIIFKIPIAGWLMSMIGDVPIVFTSKKAEHTTTDKGSVNRALDTLRNYLNNDCAVFFFPEGRRSENPDEFLEFRKGAFVMALQTGADIVPIAISGSHTIWELKHKLPRPGRCAMVVGDPISVKGMTLENDVDNLLQKSRKAVEDLYQIAKKKAKSLK